MRVLSLIGLGAILVFQQAVTALAQYGPPPKERSIIVLKPATNGVPELTDHDITAGGGEIEYKAPGRIQATLPAPAVEALRKHARVKYLQKVMAGPIIISLLPNASAPPSLRLTPSASSLHPAPEATPPTWRSGTSKYDTSGNIYSIGLPGEAGVTQHRYAYDELSRLKRADTLTTPTDTETFSYDPYGNLIEHTDGNSTTSTPVETSNTNRLANSVAHPYTYDAAGNLTADYNATYAYDPVGMLREKDYTNEPAEYYIYTASDERIGVKYGTSSGSPTIWSIRDFSGNVLRQYEGHDQSPQMAWLWMEDYVYRDGQLLAAERVPEEGGRRHFHLDHLGSPRLVTGQDSKEMSEHDYAPFGLESNYQETAGGFDREDPKRFTGHERDYAAQGESPASTAYLDYMHARYFGPNVGRFLSVDPLHGSRARPQSWNRYAYAASNPMRYVDPSGLGIVDWIKHLLGVSDSTDPKFTVYAEITVESTALPLSPLEQAFSNVLGSALQGSPQHAMLRSYGDGNVPGMSMAYWQATTMPFMFDGESSSVEDSSSEMALEDASQAAFAAADGAETFTVSAKHLHGAGGRYAKFAEGIDPHGVLREALGSRGATFLPNGQPGSFQVVTNLGRVTGSRGETAIKVVMDSSGRVWTWYPIK